MRFSTTIVSLAAGVIFIGWLPSFGCEVRAWDKSHLVITDAENGNTVAMSVGQILEVKLESQPGNGYKWYLPPNSSPALRLMEATQTKPEESGFDRPVFQIFELRAEQRGKTTFRSVYMRPWEKSKPPKKFYEVRITIK